MSSITHLSSYEHPNQFHYGVLFTPNGQECEVPPPPDMAVVIEMKLAGESEFMSVSRVGRRVGRMERME